MDIQQVVEWLLIKGYIYKTTKGGFLLTKSFHDDLKSSLKSPTLVAPEKESASKEVTVIKPTFPIPEQYGKYTYKDWVDFYQNFIIGCQVPSKMESSNGNVYSGNKYSEDGMKAFQKALKEGYRYDVLAMAIALYYKSSIRWKKAIGTYMSSGEWRSDYAQLLSKADEGSEQLTKHIKQTIDNGTGTNYEFG
jgi:tetratricopeptide (TPR) repeat protein